MSDTTDRQKKMEIMKHELQIAKSTAVKLELEFKIAQSEEDIFRMRAHQAQHNKTIEESKMAINKLNGGANG